MPVNEPTPGDQPIESKSDVDSNTQWVERDQGLVRLLRERAIHPMDEVSIKHQFEEVMRDDSLSTTEKLTKLGVYGNTISELLADTDTPIGPNNINEGDLRQELLKRLAELTLFAAQELAKESDKKLIP